MVPLELVLGQCVDKFADPLVIQPDELISLLGLDVLLKFYSILPALGIMGRGEVSYFYIETAAPLFDIVGVNHLEQLLGLLQYKLFEGHAWRDPVELFNAHVLHTFT